VLKKKKKKLVQNLTRGGVRGDGDSGVKDRGFSWGGWGGIQASQGIKLKGVGKPAKVPAKRSEMEVNNAAGQTKFATTKWRQKQQRKEAKATLISQRIAARQGLESRISEQP